MEKIALVVAALAALAVSGLSGFLLVPYLRKLKFGRTVNEIGPTWHKDKQGTPTMGGFMFSLGCCVGLLVAYLSLAGSVPANLIHHPLQLLLLSVFTFVAFLALRLTDDYLMVVRRQHLTHSATLNPVHYYIRD